MNFGERWTGIAFDELEDKWALLGATAKDPANHQRLERKVYRLPRQSNSSLVLRF
ncbi:hypothetical protein OK016_17645 [Vibrio chagasii]|nr:hypothetical protein [Vibrio chagasii]